MTDKLPTLRRDPTWLATGTLMTLFASVLVWLAAIATLPMGPAFLIPLALAGSSLCAMACLWFSPRSMTIRSSLLPIAMGALAGLAPVALVLSFRLAVTTCSVVNLFGLPWAEPWRSTMHVVAIGVWVLSCVLIAIGVALDRGLRRPAIAMLVWSAIAAVPTFVLLFITFYGDPAPGCIVS